MNISFYSYMSLLFIYVKIYILILVNGASLNEIYIINWTFFMRIHPKTLLLLDSLITFVKDNVNIMLMKKAMSYVDQISLKFFSYFWTFLFALKK